MVAPPRLVFDIVSGYVVNLGMSSRQSRSGRDMRPVRAARSCSARPDWTARSYVPGASGAIGAESEEGRLPPPSNRASPSNRCRPCRPGRRTGRCPEPPRQGCMRLAAARKGTRRERNSEGVKFWKGQDAAESRGKLRRAGMRGSCGGPRSSCIRAGYEEFKGKQQRRRC